MALLTRGRTPVFECVTPKQYVWYRDFSLDTAISSTLYAGQMLQNDYTNPGVLTTPATAVSYANLFVILTDTNRSDVEFAEGVTVADNNRAFIGKVHSDLCSGALTVGKKVVYLSAGYYMTCTTGSTVDYPVVAVCEDAVGSWYTLRFLAADDQVPAVSGDA